MLSDRKESMANWKSSDCNDILSRHVEAKKIIGNAILCPLSMGVTAIEWKLEDNSKIIIKSEDANKEDTQVAIKIDVNATITTKENKGRTKPFKCALIANFETKSNKHNKINMNSKRYDVLNEHNDVENEYHEKQLVGKRKEKLEINVCTK